MKDRHVFSVAIALAFTTVSAGGQNFAGEYADRNFLNGQAVFQMGLRQSGKTVAVWFSTAYNDGHGCGPDAEGSGKITPKGTVEFTFRDSSNNAGGGIITRAGNDIIVSLKTTRVADPRCLELYGRNIRLKSAGKK